MNKRLIAGLGLFFLSALFGIANAQPAKHGPVEKQQRHQQMRIHHGMRNGSLNRREAFMLEKQQQQIQHDKKIMQLDGHISRKERAYLKMEQAQASANIYRHKHNCQGR